MVFPPRSVFRSNVAWNRVYDHRHRVLRRRLVPLVAAGGVNCARCGNVIAPGERWHLDHDEEVPGRYLGPSHAFCNVSAAAVKSNRGLSEPGLLSREW